MVLIERQTALLNFGLFWAYKVQAASTLYRWTDADTTAPYADTRLNLNAWSAAAQILPVLGSSVMLQAFEVKLRLSLGVRCSYPSPSSGALADLISCIASCNCLACNRQSLPSNTHSEQLWRQGEHYGAVSSELSDVACILGSPDCAVNIEGLQCTLHIPAWHVL